MSDDEQEIRNLVATWIAATKADDLDAVLNLMADDVVFLVTGQPPMIGKAAYAGAAEAMRKGAQPQFEGSSEIREIRVFGEWAYLWTQLEITVTPPNGGAPIARSGPTLSVLHKQSGKWVIVRDANMLAPGDGSESSKKPATS